MAIIKLSGLVSGISGSIGGLTFVASGKGAIVRKRMRIPATNSQQQLEKRAIFMAYQREWTYELSESRREEWRQAAKLFNVTNRLGERRAISGRGFYLQQNAGFGFFRTDLPAPGELEPASPLINVNMTAEVGGPFLWTTTQSDPAFYARFKMEFARPYTSAPINTASRWRRSISLIFLPTLLAPVDLQPAFVDTWGEPTIGERIGIRYSIGGLVETLPGSSQTFFLTVAP